MEDEGRERFGTLLRRLRQGSGLTQDELARRAGLSARGLSDLERGVSRSARQDSAVLLADALALVGEARERFLHAARGHSSDSLSHIGFLPSPPTSLVGRAAEVAALETLLQPHGARLLTVTGVGGIGKTRLALEAAARVADHYPAGVWFIDLAPLTDARLVGPAIAQGLGISEADDDAIEDELVAHLARRRLLLLLDNFEQVIEAAPLVATLLVRAPEITILVTSREPLRVRGEREFAAPALGLPDLDHLADGDDQGDAVALFVERLREVRPEFQLTSESIGAVAEICVRLEGLPLAIELAAARGNLLSPVELLRRLEHRLDMLTGGPRDAPPRHQTMRDAIAWSHELLSPEERVLFRRLAVFVGGMTLDAASWVAGSAEWTLAPFLPLSLSAPRPPGSVLPAPGELADTLDCLSSLVDRSLVQRLRTPDDETRLRLLETVREFALASLAASGEEEAIRRRHAAYFLALAEEALPHLRSSDQRVCLDRLEREHDNLRAALGWAVQSGDSEAAQRLCGALALFWRMRGHLIEGRRWCQSALAMVEGASQRARADALHGAAMLAHWQGDYAVTEALYEESLGLRRELGDERGIALSLNALGILADDVGDFDRALALHEESLRRWELLGDDWGVAHALCDVANVARTQSREHEAELLYERSLAIFSRLEDVQGMAMVLDNMGDTANRLGHYERAEDYLEEAIRLQRTLGYPQYEARHLDKLGEVKLARGRIDEAERLHEQSLQMQQALGDRRGLSSSLAHLGNVDRARGHLASAAARYRESLRMRWTLQYKVGVAACLEDLASVIAALRPETAARLYGAAAALRAALGTPAPATKRQRYEEGVAHARAGAGEAEFARAWAAGQVRPLADSVAEALQTAGPRAEDEGAAFAPHRRGRAAPVRPEQAE